MRATSAFYAALVMVLVLTKAGVDGKLSQHFAPIALQPDLIVLWNPIMMMMMMMIYVVDEDNMVRGWWQRGFENNENL